MRILYATDGSPGARAGAEFLAQLRLAATDTITLLTTLLTGDGGEGRTALAQAEAILAPTGAHLEPVAHRGHPAETILALAEQSGAELIVVGWKGTSMRERFTLGSVAERVVRHARTPVLVARPLRNRLAAAVVGYDRSEEATYAVEWLQRFPLPERTELALVAVLPEIERLVSQWQAPSTIYLAELAEQAKRDRAAAERHLAEYVTRITAAGRRATALVRIGDAASELLAVAEERRADLIVVGSQGLSAVERFLMGSVSENVVRHAACSVLVVRATPGA